MIPKHDVECSFCGFKTEALVSDVSNPGICPKCQSKLKTTYNWGKLNIDIFQPYIDEHIDIKPIEINSKQQLSKECSARGITSHRLANSFNSYTPKREI